MKELLTIRKILKSKKPTFIRHDAHKKKRVGTVWRRPTGRQNKMRLHKKGYARGRSTGYGSPVAVRNLSIQGLSQNIVANLKDFSSLDATKDGIIIAGTVGDKKRLSLVAFAEKNKFTILNLDIKKVRDSISKKLLSKKARKKDILKRKESKRAKAKAAKAEAKKADEKKAETAKTVKAELADKVLPSDKENTKKDVKLEEKKEHDKVLTKKE